MERTVRAISAGEYESLSAFVKADTIRNAYLLGALQDDASRTLWRGVFEDGRLTAVAALGVTTAVAAPNPLDISYLAPEISEHAGRRIVGSDPVLRILLPLIPVAKARHARPIPQVLESVDEAHFHADRNDGSVSLATGDDLDDVLAAVSSVAAAEFPADTPKDLLPEMKKEISRIIGEDRCYLVRWEGHLLFTVHAAVLTNEIAVLEGLYTNESHRGRGIGKACLGEVCELLLAHTDRVVIAHSASNASAESIIRALGFRTVGEMATILLSR